MEIVLPQLVFGYTTFSSKLYVLIEPVYHILATDDWRTHSVCLTPLNTARTPALQSRSTGWDNKLREGCTDELNVQSAVQGNKPRKIALFGRPRWVRYKLDTPPLGERE